MTDKENQSSQVIQSTKWSAIGELMSKIASPLVNIVLARLLAPEVFGLVASFQLVTTFADVFTDAGFQKYLVQHEFASEKEKNKASNVAFWSNFIFSMAFWIVIFIARNPIASFVGCSGHGVEICVLSIQIPLHAISSIQVSLFQRSFKFKELAPIKIITSFIPIVVTVPLAFFLRSAWAIIIGTLAKEIIYDILLLIYSDWRPRLFYKLSYLKEMLSDCCWLLADSIAIWLTSYSGTFIVSQVLNEYYVGLYKTGITTISSYISLISTIVSPVLFSSFSKKQHQKSELQVEFFSAQKALLYILLPIGAACYVFRNLITQILLGSQWMDVADLMGLVGLSTAIGIGTSQLNSVYLRSVGKPKLAFTIQIVYVAIMIAVLEVFVRRPFEELCTVRGLLGFVYIAISSIVVLIAEKLSFITTLKKNIPSIVATLITSALAVYVLNLCGSSIILQIICGLGSAFLYIMLLLLIPSSRLDLIDMIKRRKII